MPQTAKGVIARAKGAEVELVDVVVPDPADLNGDGRINSADIQRVIRGALTPR